MSDEKRSKGAEAQRRYRERHGEAFRAAQREYRKKYAATEQGKKQRRKETLKHNYGITPEDYDKLLVEQNGLCAICGANEPGRGHQHFSVDHDHETGVVRGLLCNNCNRGLGLLGDNIEGIKRALNYLQTTQEEHGE